MPKGQKGEKNYFYGRRYLGELNHFYGKKHLTETIEKIKKSTWKATGKQNPMQGKKHSEEAKQKMREKRLLNARKGKDSNLWKHGKYPEHLLQRRSSDYKLWRMRVFERDNYTCQECKKKGCELNAHHIKPFSQFPGLRFEVDNGITYCKECHIKLDPFIGKRLSYVS